MKVMVNKEPKTHILYVDGLRAIAALFVVLHHEVLQAFTPDNINTLSGFKKLGIAFFFQGHLAVNLFIVISGYSLMLSVINANYHFKKGSLDFFKRRAIRILPPYYAALIISLLLIHFFIGNKTGTHWDISIPVNGMDILTHVLLIHDWFLSHEAHINHAFWSIAVECRIYLLFPLLLLLWRKTGPLVTLSASIAGAFLIYVVGAFFKTFYPDIDVAAAGVNPYLVLFVLGMLAADISFSKAAIYRSIKKLPWGILLVLSIIIFGGYKVYMKAAVDPQAILEFKILDVLFGLCTFCLLVLCANTQEGNTFQWLTKFLSWKPLVFIGTFSYSLYLIHPPLVQMLSQYLIFPLHVGAFTGTILLCIVGTIIILAIAYLFFLACERPFLYLLKSRKTSIATFEATNSPAP